MLIRELMTPEPVSCAPETPLRGIAQLMVENDCGVLPVCSEGKVVGVVTDRDIVTRGFTRTLDPTTMPVSDVMTRDLIVVHADDTIERAVQLMEGEQVHRLPVIENDRLVGMISVTDLADHLSERKAGELLREVSQSPRRARMAL